MGDHDRVESVALKVCETNGWPRSYKNSRANMNFVWLGNQWPDGGPRGNQRGGYEPL